MNTPSTSGPVDESKGLGTIGLLQIVQNLITLGLNSLELWTTVIPKLKKREEFSKNPELINLHFLLSQISQHLYSNLFQFFPDDLSQGKLPDLLSTEIPSKDILKKVKPLLNKKNFVNRTFSIESSNFLNSTVEDIISSLRVIDMMEHDSHSVLDDNTQKKKRVRRHSEDKRASKKPRRSPSPSPSESSSTSSELSKFSKISNVSDSESDSEYESVFKTVKKPTTSVQRFRQLFQTQNEKVRRKLVTPGEEGRFMVKIELTDTKDLKKLKPSQYWQKVKTKAVFLADPKCELYQNIKNVLLNVGEKVKSIKGVESDEIKLNKRSFNPY